MFLINMTLELDIKKTISKHKKNKYTNMSFDEYVNNHTSESECYIESDTDDDEVKIIRTIRIKKQKIKNTSKDTPKSESKSKDTKRKKKKVVFEYDSNNKSPVYIGKLLRMQTRTINRIEKLCISTDKNNLFGRISRFKMDEEALYYLITREIKKHICCQCGIGPIYNEQPICLLLDHIDNVESNYEEDNLRIMCPNCSTQIKGKYNVKNYMKKTTKATCTSCHREFPSIKIKGNKCKQCIEALSQQDMLSKSYNYQQYAQNNPMNFTLNTLNNNVDFEKIGDMVNIMSDRDKLDYCMTMESINNEDNKSKSIMAYDMKIDNSKMNKKYKKHIKLDFNNINDEKSLISQILIQKNESTKNIENDKNTELIGGIMFD